MKATTVIIAVTVDGDHDESQHIGDRVGHLLGRHWHAENLPRRLATDVRVHRHDDEDIADLLNKVALGEMA